MKLITGRSILSYLSLAWDSSPPYIGNGLGFRVTRRLHGCPYDIIYSTVRLELDHHGVVKETPDRKYCSQASVMRGWPTGTDRSVGRSGFIQAGWTRLQAGQMCPP